MKIIDIAANLSHDCFDEDFDQVVAAALEAGVSQMLVVGTDPEASAKSIEIAEQRSDIFRATVGMHPHHASDWSDAISAQYDQWLAHDLCVAAGEMGLDYHRNFSSREDQIRAFEAQLQLAIDHQLPAYLHMRDAHADFYPILKAHIDDLKSAIVHCFTGTQAEMEAYVELGCGIGITGWVCDERRGLDLQKIVPHIPDDRLMIETDCPYLLPRTLSPKPKTRRNEPKYLTEVLRVLAELRHTSEAELADLTRANTQRFLDFT